MVTANWILLILLLVVLAVSAFAAHKARRAHQAIFTLRADAEATKREVFALYGQLQAYDGLMRLLAMQRPLPPLRGWAASPDFLLHVCQHALASKPEVILEFGSGASTIALARCVEMNGRGVLLSFDHDPRYADATRAMLAQHGLSAFATVHHAPLEPLAARPELIWYAVRDMGHLEGRVEMVVIDGPPQDSRGFARYPALLVLHRFMSSNCRIFVDDATREGEKESIRRWCSEVEGLVITSLPTEKGCAQLSLERVTLKQ